MSRGWFSWFFRGWRVLSAATAGCCVCEGCSVHCVGLPTVLARVRSQSSFGFPIAPQTIPSWILLLHMRSHPTGRRHLIVVVRPSCAPWFVSITPTSSCIGRARCRDPVGTLRLNQARRGLCAAETDAISIRNRFVSWFPCPALCRNRPVCHFRKVRFAVDVALCL